MPRRSLLFSFTESASCARTYFSSTSSQTLASWRAFFSCLTCVRMRSPAFSCLWRCDSSSLPPSRFTPGLSAEFLVKTRHTSQLLTGTFSYNRDKCYQMRPSGIPLAWQPWPSVGSCTPLAPETIAHSYLQEPAHKLILKTVVPTVSILRGYCYTCLSNFLTHISLV